MLKNIPKLVSPLMIAVLNEMGHGDEIVIADANFPVASVAAARGAKVIRADGHGGAAVLKAVIALIPLDTYAAPNALLMEVTAGDPAATPIWEEYRKILEEREGAANTRIGSLERFAFYERAKNAYAVIATGESALYANIILKKGVLA